MKSVTASESGKIISMFYCAAPFCQVFFFFVTCWLVIDDRLSENCNALSTVVIWEIKRLDL